MTPIFFGVGTAISHEPDEPESVPVVPVVPAPALESEPLEPSVHFLDWLQKEQGPDLIDLQRPLEEFLGYRDCDRLAIFAFFGQIRGEKDKIFGMFY